MYRETKNLILLNLRIYIVYVCISYVYIISKFKLITRMTLEILKNVKYWNFLKLTPFT